MAYFKFTRAILEGRPIDIYNHGEMYRDFTYVDDLVRGIRLLIDAIPERPADPAAIAPGDSLNPVTPWRVVNIGNSRQERLLDFIAAIEDALGRKAVRNYMAIRPAMCLPHGRTALLQRLTRLRAADRHARRCGRFVAWYRDYYGA